MTGERRWSYETNGTVWNSPAVADGTVYIASFDEILYALDATTGVKRWQYEVDDIVKGSPTGPAIPSIFVPMTGNIVYIGSNDTNVYATAQTPNSQKQLPVIALYLAPFV